MANIKKKSMFAIKGATVSGGALGYETAARKYVNQGISDLGLKPNQKQALREKLIPIVARQMGVERGRTATRAVGISNRESRKSTSSANKKILGSR